MIRLDSVTKQHGPRILFVDAAAAIHRGEKVGLVGPNGAGKSTIFRLIVREEPPDDGQVSIDRGVTIGYFSQDVGEMAGRSVVAETMDGAGRRVRGRRRAARARAGAGRPGARGRARPPGRALRPRAGTLRRARRLRARGAGARDPGRPRLLAGDAGRRRRHAVGRLEDARRAGAHPADAPRCAAARRADQPPGHRVDHLARGLPEVVRRRAADDVARSRVPEPHRQQDHRDRRRRAHDVLGQLRLLRAAARAHRGAGRGAVRAPAGDARQGDALHRALQGAGRQRGAGAVAREEARQDREGRAAQAPQGARVRFPAGAALGRRRGQARPRAQGLRRPRDLRRPRSPHPPAASAGASWASTARASRRCSS